MHSSCSWIPVATLSSNGYVRLGEKSVLSIDSKLYSNKALFVLFRLQPHDVRFSAWYLLDAQQIASD